MKTQFGFDQIIQTTPMWAKWMFRITFLLTTAITLWLAGTKLVPDVAKFEIALALKSLDTVVFGLSKMFGVSTPQDEQ